MILSLAIFLLKVLGLLLVTLVIYFIHDIFWRPIRFRNRYKKYKNVYVSEKFIPLMGDAQLYMDDINAGKIFTDHMKVRHNQIKDFADLRAEVEGTNCMIAVVSHKAVKEVMNQMPHKIDRAQLEKDPKLFRSLYRFSPGNFAHFPMSKNISTRRKAYTKVLGLNQASKYIPEMLRRSTIFFDKIRKLEKIKLKEWTTQLTNSIFMSVLFGNDYDTIIEESYPYEDPDGQVRNYPLGDFYTKVCHDISQEEGNPLTHILPVVSAYNLANPWKRNYRNRVTVWNTLRKIIENSKDETSITKKIEKLGEFSKEQLFSDLLILLLAGSDDCGDTFSTILYNIAKHPEVKKKLLKEFASFGITKGCNVEEKITYENIQSMDYLANVVKESIRKDPNAPFSMFYEAYQDTQICDVPIDKGTILKIDFTGPNNDENDWLEPRKFEPDRFDTDSEFYKKSQEAGKKAGTYSRRSFGHGPRSCMGMTFGLLEMKVLTIYFLITFDYEFPQEIIEMDSVGFCIGSPFNPEIKLG